MRKFMRCNDVNSVKFWAYKIKSGVTSLLFHVLQSKNKCEQSKCFFKSNRLHLIEWDIGVKAW